MKAEIIPALFTKNLKAVPPKKPDRHLKKLTKLSPGAAYLYKNVLLKKLAGKPVNTVEIDLSAFELCDIETVCDYYENHISPDRRENKPLIDLYTAIKNSPAKTKPVEFL